jgi:DnaK suppressor protein
VVRSKSELETIKSELLSRKQELEEKLIELSRERVSDDQVQDPGDQALTSTMESLRTSLQSAETDEYQRIVRALEKIEAGTYGICIDCNEPISEKRLKSYPNAARCLACQELFEDKERE